MISKEDYDTAYHFLRKVREQGNLTLHHKLLVIIAAASLTRVCGYYGEPGFGLEEILKGDRHDEEASEER